MLEIKDAVAVITGGASGIGLAVAQYWADAGGKVVIGDVAEKTLNEVAAAINGEVATVVCGWGSKDRGVFKLRLRPNLYFGSLNLIPIDYIQLVKFNDPP